MIELVHSTFRYNDRILSLGPVGPPKFRLGLGKLDSGEEVIINKNVFFVEGRPIKNRLIQWESEYQTFEYY